MSQQPDNLYISEIQVLRPRTEKEWQSKDPVIPYGYAAYSKDTHMMRIGNGRDKWSTLAPTTPTNYVGPHGHIHTPDGIDPIPGLGSNRADSYLLFASEKDSSTGDVVTTPEEAEKAAQESKESQSESVSKELAPLKYYIVTQSEMTEESTNEETGETTKTTNKEFFKLKTNGSDVSATAEGNEPTTGDTFEYTGKEKRRFKIEVHQRYVRKNQSYNSYMIAYYVTTRFYITRANSQSTGVAEPSTPSTTEVIPATSIPDNSVNSTFMATGAPFVDIVLSHICELNTGDSFYLKFQAPVDTYAYKQKYLTNGEPVVQVSNLTIYSID